MISLVLAFSHRNTTFSRWHFHGQRLNCNGKKMTFDEKRGQVTPRKIIIEPEPDLAFCPYYITSCQMTWPLQVMWPIEQWSQWSLWEKLSESLVLSKGRTSVLCCQTTLKVNLVFNIWNDLSKLTIIVYLLLEYLSLKPSMSVKF